MLVGLSVEVSAINVELPTFFLHCLVLVMLVPEESTSVVLPLCNCK
jgi:uncharacterized membrane protein